MLRSVLLLALPALALAPGTSASAAGASCKSGQTLRRDADARVFSARKGVGEMRIYACRTGSRRPTLLYEDAGYAGDLKILRRDGRRVVFVVSVVGNEDSASITGWFDVRTGAHRSRGDTGPEVDAVAVAPDGTVVVERESVVSVLRPGSGRHVLAAPRRIGASELPLVPASLRIAGERVSWRTTAGTRATVGLDGTPVADPDPSPVCQGAEVTVREGEAVTIPLVCEDTGPVEGRTPLTVRLACRSCFGPPSRGDLGARAPGPPATVTTPRARAIPARSSSASSPAMPTRSPGRRSSGSRSSARRRVDE